MKTIIISDLHLGSDVCRARELEQFLDHIEKRCDRLILNGDVFDSINFRRLKKHHWNVLSLLRKVSDKIDVIWVCGNHDGTAEIVSHLLGICVVDEFEFESDEKRVLVLHGHVFDKFITARPIITKIAEVFYRSLQRIDKSNWLASVAMKVKKRSRIYLRNAENIRLKSIKYAKEKGCDIVCCGHTHQSVEDRSTPIQYFNSGCWTEIPCHYLEINNGIVMLHAFSHNPE
jgi:UDP-2,3-diacylglucosamine pyrophosphatase LpxH